MTPKSRIDASHPIGGVWIEDDNSDLRTPVVFTIKVRAGSFRVTGVDESDGIALRTSNIAWDGKKLRFETVFPLTRHKASHEFWVTKKGQGRHKVTYSDEYGRHAITEFWKKRGVNPLKP
jgi:hypothetical protein